MRSIDADALIAWTDNYYDSEKFTVGHFANMVKDMPTIEERKTGKWINANDGKWNTVEVLKCSVCGEIDNRMYRTDNFCPNCGADMREGEQDG